MDFDAREAGSQKGRCIMITLLVTMVRVPVMVDSIVTKKADNDNGFNGPQNLRNTSAGLIVDKEQETFEIFRQETRASYRMQRQSDDFEGCNGLLTKLLGNQKWLRKLAQVEPSIHLTPKTAAIAKVTKTPKPVNSLRGNESPHTEIILFPD